MIFFQNSGSQLCFRFSFFFCFALTILQKLGAKRVREHRSENILLQKLSFKILCHLFWIWVCLLSFREHVHIWCGCCPHARTGRHHFGCEKWKWWTELALLLTCLWLSYVHWWTGNSSVSDQSFAPHQGYSVMGHVPGCRVNTLNGNMKGSFLKKWSLKWSGH